MMLKHWTWTLAVLLTGVVLAAWSDPLLPSLAMADHKGKPHGKPGDEEPPPPPPAAPGTIYWGLAGTGALTMGPDGSNKTFDHLGPGPLLGAVVNANPDYSSDS